MKRFLLILAALAAAGGITWWVAGRPAGNYIPGLVKLIQVRAGLARIPADPEIIRAGLEHLPPGNLRILHRWMQAEAEQDVSGLARLIPRMRITVLPAMAADERLHPVARMIFSQYDEAKHDEGTVRDQPAH